MKNATCGETDQSIFETKISTLCHLSATRSFAKASKEVVDLRVECQPSSKLFDLGILHQLKWCGFQIYNHIYEYF